VGCGHDDAGISEVCLKCATGSVRALDFSKPMLVVDDGGRHIAMLPSRGLRPAQLAPLASRQSTVLRTNATRKVRICEFHCPLRPFHTPAFSNTSRPSPCLCPFSAQQPNQSRHSAIANCSSFRPFPELRTSQAHHVEPARSSQRCGNRARTEPIMS